MASKYIGQIVTDLDSIFYAYKEKIAGAGEDSFCYQMGEQSVLLGVFDGCGGSGARLYENYHGQTGAYMASRAVAGVTQRLFECGGFADSVEETANRVHTAMLKSLAVCKENSGIQGGSKLKGSIAKEFPTTAAIACCTPKADGVSIDCYWAGDSRVYLLDEDGLAQITADDLDGLDAYENISGDGVLTNVISASKPFRIHSARITSSKPVLVFAATDGCFGYIPTPMEFEAFLLECLCSATSMAEFECRITKRLEKIAGDDYTLVGAAFGYGTFSALKSSFVQRACDVAQTYQKSLEHADSETVLALWKKYQKNYSRYISGR